jgi:ribosomal protein S25
MTHTVAVVGPEESVSTVLQVGKGMPDLQMIPLVYDVESEAPALVSDLPEAVAAVLFTGPVPYQMAESHLRGKPSTFIPFTGAALYKGLFELKGVVDLERLSIDTLTPAEVADEYASLGLDATRVHSVRVTGGEVSGRQFQFHREAFAAGLTSGAITGLRSTYKALRQAGVPAAWMAPPRSVVVEALNRCRLLGTVQRSSSSQIAIGLVEVTDPAHSGTVHKGVSDFALALDGLVVGLSPVSLMFITTRGMIERATASFMRMPLLDGRQPALGMVIGIGMGPTAVVAARHAQEAVNRAKEHGSGSAFVITADRAVFGPIGAEKAAARRSRITDPRTLRLAAQAHLNPATIDRVREAVSKLAFDAFTVEDLAQTLRIGKRSAQRLVRQLREVGIVQVRGKESLTGRGKPRFLYTWLERSETGLVP